LSSESIVLGNLPLASGDFSRDTIAGLIGYGDPIDRAA
jgi:hypothetical protein